MTSATRWRVVAELAASQHGAFHRSQAASNGINARQLRRAAERGELRRPLSDVFVVAGAPPTWRQRLMCLSLSGATVAGRAAAALHGLDGSVEGKLEVVFARGSHRSMPPGVVVHRWRDLDVDDIAAIDGIRVTNLTRTLVELARVSPPQVLERALDSVLRAGVPAEEIDTMIDRLWRPGRTGLGPLRSALRSPDRSGPPPDSMFERMVERLIVEHGLPQPVRQHQLTTSAGPRRLDLAWPVARVAVECHSKRWHFDQQSRHDDNARDLELAVLGWEVIYVTWKMAQTPASFLPQLRRLLADRFQQASGS